MIGNWVHRNLRKIIIWCFVIPILLVAFVSISHVTELYGLTSPLTWSIYLSVAIEIAALSALAGISVRMGKFIYFPFIVVTLIQFIGNMFYTYSFIDPSSDQFKEWVDFIEPLLTLMGVEGNDIPAQRRILAFFTGGLLPIISLTFAHMLVVFSERETGRSVEVPMISYGVDDTDETVVGQEEPVVEDIIDEVMPEPVIEEEIIEEIPIGEHAAPDPSIEVVQEIPIEENNTPEMQIEEPVIEEILPEEPVKKLIYKK